MINTPKIYKMRVAFTVAGVWDHKRIFAALRDMVLRSGLPFEPAKVNKNWPRLAYGPALGYGQYSLGEYADIYLSSPVKEDAALQALKTACRTGVTVTRVQRVPYGLPSVSNLAEVYRYGVEGNFAFYRPNLPAEEFFEGKHIFVTEAAPNGMTVQRDIKPFVLSAVQPRPERVELLLQRCGDKTAKPEHVIAAWLGVQVPAEAEFTLERLKFIREALYWRDAAGEPHAI